MSFFSSLCRISLNTMTLQVESPTVYTSQGVPISVTGIAQVTNYWVPYEEVSDMLLSFL